MLLATSFAWIAMSPTFVAYVQVVGQMVLMGLGLGLTTAPATESILSVLPPAKAGVGSAVNDATREAGGTLGVAVIGSVFTSLYASTLATTSFGALPARSAEAAKDSVAAAMATAAGAPGEVGQALLTDVQAAFMTGFRAGEPGRGRACAWSARSARSPCPAGPDPPRSLTGQQVEPVAA